MAKKPTRIGCFNIAAALTNALHKMDQTKDEIMSVENREQWLKDHDVKTHRKLARGIIKSARQAVVDARGKMNGVVRSHLRKAISELDQAKRGIPLKKGSHYSGHFIAGYVMQAKDHLDKAFTFASQKCQKGY